MPLLAATSAFKLGRRRWSSQQCYLHRLRAIADIVYSTLLPLQEIKPTAYARMKLTRIMLAALIQFMNAFQPTHCDIFHWLLISRSQFLRFAAFCWPYP